MDNPVINHLYIIDDDDDVLLVTSRVVSLLGWTFRAFSSAMECLDAIQKQAPACVISDLNMPGMDGAEFLKALADLGLEVPVIVLTGESPGSPLRSRAHYLAAEVITKPCSIHELDRALKKWAKPEFGGQVNRQPD